MSRRGNRPAASGLDSDSFLDVVANLVAILIILVVVAGVKVSQSPVLVPTPAAQPDVASTGTLDPNAADVASAILALPGEEAIIAKPVDTSSSKSVAQEPAPRPLPPVPHVVPPSELVDLAATLAKAVAELDTTAAEKSVRLASITGQQQELQQQLAAVNDDLQLQSATLHSQQARLKQMQSFLRERAAQLEQLQRETSLAGDQPAPPPKSLEYSLTPIARVVEQQQLMFYVSGNRVTVIPWDELVALAIDELRRTTPHIPRREPIDRPRTGFTNSYGYSQTLTLPTKQAVSHVVLGPIGGFSLDCTRGRLAEGDSMFTSYEFVPDPNLPGETADEALRPNSEFLHAVQTAGAETTLTFWVYPDSFDVYHRLREVCQQQGFRVAGRPMPTGVNVGASPDGSRSVSQ